MITYTQLLNGDWIVRLQANNFGAGTLIWDSEPQGCESKARELAVKFRDMLGWGKLSQAQRVKKIIELNQNDRQVQERKAAMERALRQTKQEKLKPTNTQNLMDITQIAAPGAESPEDSKTDRTSIACVQLPSGKWCVRMRARLGSECLTWDSPPCESELSAQAKAVAIQLKEDWDRQHENQRFNIVLKKIELDKIDAHLNKFKTKITETTKTGKDMKTGKRDMRYIQKKYNGFCVALKTTKNSRNFTAERGFKTYEEALKWRDDNININEWKSASRVKRRAIINNLRARRDCVNIPPEKESAPITPTAPSRRGFWERLAERLAAVFRQKKQQSSHTRVILTRKNHPELPSYVSVALTPQKNGFAVHFGQSKPGSSACISWEGATEKEMLRIAKAIIKRVGWEWRSGDIEHNRRMVEKVRAIIKEYRPMNYGNRR